MRWLVLIFLALSLVTGCDLNPQPEVPGDTEPEGAAGAAGAPGAASGDFAGKASEPGDDDPAEYAPDDSNLASVPDAARPDPGPGEREAPDAGAEAASPPPIVAM